jgi:hypothetical protein
MANYKEIIERATPFEREECILMSYEWATSPGRVYDAERYLIVTSATGDKRLAFPANREDLYDGLWVEKRRTCPTYNRYTGEPLED